MREGIGVDACEGDNCGVTTGAYVCDETGRDDKGRDDEG